MRKIYLLLFFISACIYLPAQTPVSMSAQPGLSYTEDFADIANWTNGFAAGAGAEHFAPVAVNAAGTIPDGSRITTATANFVTGTSGGVQRGSAQPVPAQSIVLLSTGASDNTSATAIDFFMDFTGVNAGTLSFDWASINNSTGDRRGSLRIYYSTDGAIFTELPAAQVLNFINNSPSSGSLLSVALPAAFNNNATARLRLYYHNGTGGAAGSRPKISIDNLTVTASPAGGSTVSVSPAGNAAEPATGGSFTINFSTPTTAATDIGFDFGGTAGFATDYTVTYSTGIASSATSTGVLTVPSGTSSVTVTVSPADDNDVEPTETISLAISAPTGGYTLGAASAAINLTDNDIASTVSVAAGINAAEPATNGTFTLTLSAAAPVGGVTVNYSLTGTADINTDYTDPQTGSITIAEGNTTATLTLNVTDDADPESPETIVITLDNVSSPYIIAAATASINLTSEDFFPILLTGNYSQDFNTLANAGTANAIAIPGWILNETGNGARDNELHAADNGGSNTGDTYSYGVAASTERALGSLQSGTLISSFGSAYINNSAPTISRLRISYTGEQWRLGATDRNDRLDFQYSTDATNLVTGTWIDVDQLDFIAPHSTGTVGSLVGNDAANRVTVTFDITNLSIPIGTQFFIRWNDANASGSDDGLAIDDFSIEANPVDLAAPVITSLSPANGAGDISVNTVANIVFDEPVIKLDGNILIRHSSDNSIFQTIPVGSTAIVVSSASVTFNLANLTPNTTYYIEIGNAAFEDQSGNVFAGISGNSTWAFTTGSGFYTVDFNSCSSSLTNGFTERSLIGDVVWACTPFGRDPAAPAGSAAFPSAVQINGFSGGTNVPNVDWLISPPFDLSATTYPLLSFWSRTAFNGPPLQLKVSTNYAGGNPVLATWTDLNGKFPAQASNVWTLSADINLTAYKGANVYFAFVYTSSADDGARWTIDDISLNNSATPPPPSLTLGNTDIQFTYVASGSAADKTFVFTGNDLTGDVTLNAAGDFLLSKNGSSFSTSIVYPLTEVNDVPTTVYVRFAPTQPNQNFTGTAIINTSGLADTVSLKGTSIDPATTLEVVNWNMEWFGSTDPSLGPTNDDLQEQNAQTILQNTGADLYAVVEVVDEARLANIVSQMPGYSYVISDYGSHTNINENDASPLSEAQKEAFIYKTSVFSNITSAPLLSQGTNSVADLSNPAYNYWSSGRFPFLMSADVTLNCVTKNIKFVLVHAKANTSPTATSYARRKAGADTLYYTLNTLYPNENIVLLGDLNDDLDLSITAGFTTTSWDAFTTDVANYEALTLPLSLAGKKSTVSYNDIIDHVIISSELSPFYMDESASILNDVTSLVTNYGNTTSDHYPVFTRYLFTNTTAPVITSCPAATTLCATPGNSYNIAPFTATDDCDPVIYSYVISGATVRTGTTSDASGLFNAGTSTITWTAKDNWGNTSTCQTTVLVNDNPVVIIPDAFALSSGTVANTVYRGYAPASSITLNAAASGGAPAYTYSWTTGSVAASATVSPLTTTNYTVTVTDMNGCQATADKTITVKDIRAGGNKVILCHKPNAQANTLEVATAAVQAHLAHGDMLGSCPGPEYPAFRASASPNPTWNHFRIQIQGGSPAQTVRLRVLDIFGRVIETRNNLQTNQTITIGGNYKRGLYFAELVQGNERVIIPLLKI